MFCLFGVLLHSFGICSSFVILCSYSLIDGSVSVSWKDLLVPAIRTADLSFLLHTGYHYPGHPPIDALGGVAPINVGGHIRVNFHITDDAMSNAVFKIFVVIDNDVFEIAVVAEN
jgi:hypothetical protein